jgi:hypothetical protein
MSAKENPTAETPADDVCKDRRETEAAEADRRETEADRRETEAFTMAYRRKTEAAEAYRRETEAAFADRREDACEALQEALDFDPYEIALAINQLAWVTVKMEVDMAKNRRPKIAGDGQAPADFAVSLVETCKEVAEIVRKSGTYNCPEPCG